MVMLKKIYIKTIKLTIQSISNKSQRIYLIKALLDHSESKFFTVFDQLHFERLVTPMTPLSLNPELL